LTFVLGPYGDIVTRPGDRAAYLSWYHRVHARLVRRDLAAAGLGHPAVAGQPAAATAETIARETLTALDRIVPASRRAGSEEVDAGVIFSWWATFRGRG
jgi:hypothetical protein